MKIDQVDVSVRGARGPASARRRRVRQQRVGGARQRPVPRRVHDLVERRWRVRDAAGTARFRSCATWRERTRLLYRQSTSLRTRWMVDRFEAWRANPRRARPPHPTRVAACCSGWPPTIATRDATPPPSTTRSSPRFPEHRTFTDGRGRAGSGVRADGVRPARTRPGRGARLPRLVAHRGGPRPASTRLRTPPTRRNPAERLTFEPRLRRRIRTRMTTTKIGSVVARAGDTAGQPLAGRRART